MNRARPMAARLISENPDNIEEKRFSFIKAYLLIPVINENHCNCKIVTELDLFVRLTKLIVVSSLLTLKLINGC